MLRCAAVTAAVRSSCVEIFACESMTGHSTRSDLKPHYCVKSLDATGCRLFPTARCCHGRHVTDVITRRALLATVFTLNGRALWRLSPCSLSLGLVTALPRLYRYCHPANSRCSLVIAQPAGGILRLSSWTELASNRPIILRFILTLSPLQKLAVHCCY
jgi:hypothetical protein